MVERQGVLIFLKPSWVGENKGAQIDTMPIHEYINKFRGCLERTANKAKIPSEGQQGKITYHYNLRSKEKTFEIGDKVLLLISDSTGKLYSRWQDPATILEKRN